MIYNQACDTTDYYRKQFRLQSYKNTSTVKLLLREHPLARTLQLRKGNPVLPPLWVEIENFDALSKKGFTVFGDLN